MRWETWPLALTDISECSVCNGKVKSNEIFRFSQRSCSAAPKSKRDTCIFISPLSLLKMSSTFSRVVQEIPVFGCSCLSPHQLRSQGYCVLTPRESSEMLLTDWLPAGLDVSKQSSRLSFSLPAVELFKCKSLFYPKFNMTLLLASVCTQLEPQSGVKLSSAIGCCCSSA